MAGWTGSIEAPLEDVATEMLEHVDERLCAELRPRQPEFKLVTHVFEPRNADSTGTVVVMLEEVDNRTYITVRSCAGSSDGFQVLRWSPDTIFMNSLKKLLTSRFGKAFVVEQEFERPLL